MRRIPVVLSLVAVASAAVYLPARQSVQKATFEVASIKSVASGRRGPINTSPGGLFVAAGQPLQGLITYAYRVRDYQIIGGPTWINLELWEIQAKTPEGSVAPHPRVSRTRPEEMERLLNEPDVISLMLQSLLEERFRLKVHRETRELPIFEVVVAKGGPKLRLSEDQHPVDPVDGQRPPLPPLANGLPVLQPGSYRISRKPNGSMRFAAKGLPLWTLINSLKSTLGRPVIDKTDLKGLYDYELEWAMDPVQVPPSAGDSPTGSNGGLPPAGDPSSGPDLATALQEQLGLRLVPAKGPVEVMVIDSVQKPTVN